mgnify:CR=1 FL=1
MKPINIKAMMALIEKEPDNQYIPVLKPVLMQALTEIKQRAEKTASSAGKWLGIGEKRKSLNMPWRCTNDDVE